MCARFRVQFEGTLDMRYMPRKKEMLIRRLNRLSGFRGASVLEIVAQHRGDTWRAVYTVRYPEAVYVLHAFQKKSKRGAATTKKDIDLIRQRLNEAERQHRTRQN